MNQFDATEPAFAAIRAQFKILLDDRAELLAALRKIDEAHIPDCPAHFAGDELEWAQRHVARLRGIARAAIAKATGGQS